MTARHSTQDVTRLEFWGVYMTPMILLHVSIHTSHESGIHLNWAAPGNKSFVYRIESCISHVHLLCRQLMDHCFKDRVFLIRIFFFFESQRLEMSRVYVE